MEVDVIRVSVIGAQGRMGARVVQAVGDADDMQLAQAIGVQSSLEGVRPDNTDVAVEFTVPSASLSNVLALVD